MKNMFCIEGDTSTEPLKYYKTAAGQWMSFWPYKGPINPFWEGLTMSKQNCNECRHKLACLVDMECDRRFKSK